MKLYKFILIVLLSSTLNVNANPGSESWRSWFMNLKTDKQIQLIIEQFLSGPNKAQKIAPKGLISDVATSAKAGCDALNKQMTGFESAKKVTTATVASTVAQSTDVATPAKMGCDALRKKITGFESAKKVTASTVAQSTNVATPAKAGCDALSKQMTDFDKTFQKIKPDTTTRFTTRFLDAVNDPWVRLAVVAGVIVFARYKYNQAQEQLKEFDEDEEETATA